MKTLFWTLIGVLAAALGTVAGLLWWSNRYACDHPEAGDED